MKTRDCVVGCLVAAAASWSTAPIALAAPMVNLTGLGYVQYGDALSYSLPIAGLEKNGSTPSPGEEFYVSSTPGQIQNLVVVATGTSSNPTTTNFAGMDNAYATPSGASGSTYFSTGTYTDPSQVGGAFTGDQAQTWDANLGALSSFLGGEDMIFFFNNNNVNSGGSASQTLAAWMQISITDSLGNVITVAPYAPGTGNANGQAVWELTNNNSPYALVSEGGGGVFNGDPGLYQAGSAGSGPDVGSNLDTDYVLSGGAICLDADITPVSCAGPHVYGPINHNLGADQAAYGVIFPEFNALLDAMVLASVDLSELTLHVDLRMGCDPGFAGIVEGSCPIFNNFGKDLNNGYEQLFIGTASAVFQEVPEPATLALLGLGLAGLVVTGRRRKLI